MGVRRGRGTPVKIGRGVTGGLGVKITLGATCGVFGLNGVGEITARSGGVCTFNRYCARSKLTLSPSARKIGAIST